MHFDLSQAGQLAAAIVPDLIVMGGAMLLLLFAVWRRESEAHQRRVGIGAIVICLVAMAAVILMMVGHATASPGIIAVDNFRWATDFLVLLATIIAIVLTMDYNRREGIVLGEGYVLLLLSTAGMMLLAAARDLIIVFLGIELMSVAVYVLAGLNRRSSRAAEAAIKYFLLGAFSTGFLLYGIALIYGGTGSTDLAVIGSRISAASVGSNAMLLAGVALLLVGFAFKVAAVPFHMWTPDVYEGAPTPFTAYMAAAVKAAAFAAFFRVWLEAFPHAIAEWHAVLWWLAAITMVVGNLIALVQKNIKRLLAYSSIAHAGYILVAIVSATALGASAFLFYLLAYTLATMGAFAVVVAVGQAGERNQDLADYAGLWRVRPWLATAMAVFMLALLGFPVAGGMGFFAKWYVLQAALRAPAPQTHLAVLLVITSVISAGYYLGVVMVMFMRPRAADAPALLRTPALTRLVIGAAAVGLLFFGIFPGSLVRVTSASVPTAVAQQSDGGPPLSAAGRAH
ncbi:MAG TPA: NADH-quinone oxidoreductase subunit N [Gemmatimonadaceae bacterium]|nr:NADH-quinone oxidoreductase subunit N [Gemmatimonadaceae bacterium]